MNFLLHLIGTTQRDAVLRPTPRQFLAKKVCREALAGNFPAAAEACDELAHIPGRQTVTEPLIRGHLRLLAKDYPAAAHFFSAGVARLNATQSSCVSEFSHMFASTEDAPAVTGSAAREGSTSRLERLIDSADVYFRQGRYVRAIELFQRARALLDTLLSAHAGMIVADARIAGHPAPESAKPLVALANLGDLLLRMLARTHLAANVAAGLRHRSLRDDLAPWATRGSDADELLRGEFALLVESAKQNPDHAELHYRLGLVARAVGDRATAESAFTQVIQLHPHHVLSAARLAATLLQANQFDAVMPLLAAAFAVPPQTLRNYEQLAQTISDGRSFDRAVARLCHDLGDHPNAPTVRANLAFALSELGLLDEERAAWRETAPAA
jgi:tetratricopeptide (TPR) repeat protein